MKNLWGVLLPLEAPTGDKSYSLVELILFYAPELGVAEGLLKSDDVMPDFLISVVMVDDIS